MCLSDPAPLGLLITLQVREHSLVPGAQTLLRLNELHSQGRAISREKLAGIAREKLCDIPHVDRYHRLSGQGRPSNILSRQRLRLSSCGVCGSKHKTADESAVSD
jgi:hypothetical protein